MKWNSLELKTKHIHVRGSWCEWQLDSGNCGSITPQQGIPKTGRSVQETRQIHQGVHPNEMVESDAQGWWLGAGGAAKW